MVEELKTENGLSGEEIRVFRVSEEETLNDVLVFCGGCLTHSKKKGEHNEIFNDSYDFVGYHTCRCNTCGATSTIKIVDGE